MKKKIAILGSTGSIGKTLLKIIKKDKFNNEVVLLTANKNYKQLINQAIYFKVKNIVILDKKGYQILKKKKFNFKIKIFNNFENFNKIFKKKIDYTMNSIVGLDGLDPTLKIIKHTKIIAIANKESIICGWNLIKKELKKNKTNFIPVDSEHFSIWYALINNQIKDVDRIYLTASGGPLLKYRSSQLKDIKISKILKHPTWNMGKKISVDSATMMNKVFEIIEAKKIFDIPYNKLSILIHPKSYLHGIVKFKNGLIKLIAHDTTMEIPIFNTLYSENLKKKVTYKIDFKKLNDLNLELINYKKFPLVKIIKNLPVKHSLFETIIVSANDELVNLFLKRKIKFVDISIKLMKVINSKEFKIYKKIQPRNVRVINNLSKYVRLKVLSMSV